MPTAQGAALTAAAVLLLASLSTSALDAQWIRHPTAGVPRTADGKVNMSAPAPRTADGKPDFSGIWTCTMPRPVASRRPKDPPNPHDANPSRRMINLGVDLPGGLPYQPWLAARVKETRANNSKNDPHVRCMPLSFVRAYGMPHLIKFVQTPNLLLMLNEWNAMYRQVFTDGRAVPQDPNPAWMGYSSAKWSGDTLVVDTLGFRDDVWLDWGGAVLTEGAKVREEIRRPDLGHLEIQITVDDPKAYTKPWTVLVKERLIVDAELIDEICLENERSLQHMK